MLLLGMRGLTTEEDFEHVLPARHAGVGGPQRGRADELGERLLVQGIAGSLYPEAWRLVEAHRRAGHTVVLASSATRFQVEPAARAMGVEHVLVHARGDRERASRTGRPGGPPLWRAGKAARGADVRAGSTASISAASYAYSNGDEDVAVPQHGRPPAGAEPRTGAGGRRRRRRLADRPVPPPRPAGRARDRPHGGGGRRHARRLRPRASHSARSTASRHAARPSISALTLAGELGTALAGVRLDVRGAEHLVSARPAVFLFNHQSQLDVLILAEAAARRLHRRREEGGGERARVRADVPARRRGVRRPRRHRAGRRPWSPRSQRLREGISLVIAPEGTRSATPALGRFKKGAFHVAMQAGVPIVPIVIRNAGELMWRGASTLREGTVQVTVLPRSRPTGGRWRSWTATSRRSVTSTSTPSRIGMVRADRPALRTGRSP